MYYGVSLYGDASLKSPRLVLLSVSSQQQQRIEEVSSSSHARGLDLWCVMLLVRGLSLLAVGLAAAPTGCALVPPTPLPRTTAGGHAPATVRGKHVRQGSSCLLQTYLHSRVGPVGQIHDMRMHTYLPCVLASLKSCWQASNPLSRVRVERSVVSSQLLLHKPRTYASLGYDECTQRLQLLQFFLILQCGVCSCSRRGCRLLIDVNT